MRGVHNHHGFSLSGSGLDIQCLLSGIRVGVELVTFGRYFLPISFNQNGRSLRQQRARQAPCPGNGLSCVRTERHRASLSRVLAPRSPRFAAPIGPNFPRRYATQARTARVRPRAVRPRSRAGYALNEGLSLEISMPWRSINGLGNRVLH